MTRPKNSRSPVSSFGPELMEALIRASRDRVEIPFPDMNTMRHFQMRIHMLRGAMQRERHPSYSLVTRVHTSCQWDFSKHPKGAKYPRDATDCVLLMYPKDSQFKDILKNVGIVPGEAAQDILESEALPDTPANPIVEPSRPTVTDDTTPATPDPYQRFK